MPCQYMNEKTHRICGKSPAKAYVIEDNSDEYYTGYESITYLCEKHKFSHEYLLSERRKLWIKWAREERNRKRRKPHHEGGVGGTSVNTLIGTWSKAIGYPALDTKLIESIFPTNVFVNTLQYTNLKGKKK